MSLHVPFDCGIRGKLPNRGISFHQGGEVVVVQLVAPVGVVLILPNKSLGQGLRERDLATVFARSTAQRTNGVVLLAEGRVIPACDGAGCDANVTPGHRMGPEFFSERADCLMERSACWGRAQE